MSSSVREFGATASLFPGRMLKKRHMRHPEILYILSDDDFETPEVFPIFCVIYI